MSIALRNTRRHMQVFNLPHQAYCRGTGVCACSEQTVTTVQDDARTGERRARSVVRRIPTSITWLALETRVALHEGLLELPEVRRAIDAGDLRVTQDNGATRTKRRTHEARDTHPHATDHSPPAAGEPNSSEE